MLTPDEYNEYQLRSSDAASYIRMNLGAFEATNAEFRALFGTLQNLAEGPQRDYGSILRSEAALTKLRQQLEPDRFEALQRAFDPAFRELHGFGERFGLPAGDIERINNVSTEARSAISEISNNTSLSEQEIAQRHLSVRRLASEELRSILGADRYQLFRDGAQHFSWLGPNLQ